MKSERITTMAFSTFPRVTCQTNTAQKQSRHSEKTKYVATNTVCIGLKLSYPKLFLLGSVNRLKEMLTDMNGHFLHTEFQVRLVRDLPGAPPLLTRIHQLPIKSTLTIQHIRKRNISHTKYTLNKQKHLKTLNTQKMKE